MFALHNIDSIIWARNGNWGPDLMFTKAKEQTAVYWIRPSNSMTKLLESCDYMSAVVFKNSNGPVKGAWNVVCV